MFIFPIKLLTSILPQSLPSNPGVSNLWVTDPTCSQISGSIRLELRGTRSVMSLSHPGTTPPPLFLEKLSSTKPVPDAKMFGDRCSNPFST